MERYWQLALACKCSHNCTEYKRCRAAQERQKSTDPRIILSKRERQTKITKKIYLYLQASGQPASSRGHECWWRRQASRLLPLSMALSSILPYRSTVFSPSLQASNAFVSFLLFLLSQRSPSPSLSPHGSRFITTYCFDTIAERSRKSFLLPRTGHTTAENQQKQAWSNQRINQSSPLLLDESVSFQDCFSQYKFLNPATAVQEIALPFKSTKMPFELQTINWKGQKQEKKLQILAHLWGEVCISLDLDNSKTPSTDRKPPSRVTVSCSVLWETWWPRSATVCKNCIKLRRRISLSLARMSLLGNSNNRRRRRRRRRDNRGVLATENFR